MVKASKIVLGATVSAPLAAAITPSCAVHGQAYNDTSLGNAVNGAYQADAYACQALCKTQVTCEHFTWLASTKACLLQSGKDTIYDNKDAISGPADCSGDAHFAPQSAHKAAEEATAVAAKILAEKSVVDGKAAAAAKAASDAQGTEAAKVAADAKAVADESAASLAAAAAAAVADQKATVAATRASAENAAADAKAAAEKAAADAKAAAEKEAALTTKAATAQGAAKAAAEAMAESNAAATAASAADTAAGAAADAKALAAKISADEAAAAAAAVANAKAIAEKAAADTKAAADKKTATAAKLAADEKAAADAKAVTTADGVAAEKAVGKVVEDEVAALDPKAVLPNAIPECAETGKAYNDGKRNDMPNGGTQPTAAKCQKICQQTVYCDRFTWYKDSGSCWLQGTDSVTQFQEKDAISGPVSCEAVAAQDAPAATPAAKTKKVGGFPWFFWVIGGLGVALVAGGFAMYMLSSGAKKKKKRTVAVAEAAPDMEAAQSKPLMSAARGASQSMQSVQSVQSAPVVSTTSYMAVPQPVYAVQQAPAAVYAAAPVPTIARTTIAAPAVAASSYTVAPAQYVTTAQSAFDALDRDGDGVLTRAELAAAGLR
eukprot:TRINITY_DN14301_c0_g1_i1.p1 TRINITY_DN14301_c0_g1~~TRINITY_DN14301_c0_g1_i1.p1  ORF type:complete len:607 (+),score=232.70 TRINITY_DN14301_c0_g1_i1:73-1893(+)